MSWQEIGDLFANKKIVEVTKEEDPGAKYLYTDDETISSKLDIDPNPTYLKQINTQILEIEGLKRQLAHLQLQMKAFSNVKKGLTDLKVKIESAQDELSELSDYILRKKSLKMRCDPSIAIQQKIFKLSEKMTETYAYILKLLENILDEPTRTNDSDGSPYRPPSFYGGLYAERIPGSVVPCMSGTYSSHS